MGGDQGDSPKHTKQLTDRHSFVKGGKGREEGWGGRRGGAEEGVGRVEGQGKRRGGAGKAGQGYC